jgi:predicted nucleic acid-binding protein
MRIYADTSFLVSFLFTKDKHQAEARHFFSKFEENEWLISEWSWIETVNSLRQLCRNGLKSGAAEAIIRYFKHLHQAGPFERVNTRMDEALQDCVQLSAAHGSQLRMRSADVLHVALLEQIAPALFITRDKDQYALAKARAFPSTLVA